MTTTKNAHPPVLNARAAASLTSEITVLGKHATMATVPLALGLLLAPAIAQADAPSPKEEMSVRGFDAAVARAHGYEVVTLPDGAQASVPADKADAARLGAYRPSSGIVSRRSTDAAQTQGYGEVPGDCGISWVSLTPIGASRAHLDTGFIITDSGAGSVWDVDWNVSIHDNGGSSNQPYEEQNGSSWGSGWTAYQRTLGLTRGWADATIVWYNSIVITTHGWVCWSNGPTAVDQIY
jgi:hypothetical protein